MKPPTPADTRAASERLREAITQAGLTAPRGPPAHRRHVRRQPRLRAQGFGGSMEYLLDVRGAGYQPTVQVFDFPFFKQLEPSTFVRNTPTPRTYVENTDFLIMSFSGSGDTTAPLRPVDIDLTPPRASTSGCEAADFADFPRGRSRSCSAAHATSCQGRQREEAGACGAIIFNQGNTAGGSQRSLRRHARSRRSASRLSASRTPTARSS